MSSVTSGPRLPRRSNVAFRTPTETSWSPLPLLLAVVAGLAFLVAIVVLGNAGVAFLDALGRL